MNDGRMEWETEKKEHVEALSTINVVVNIEPRQQAKLCTILTPT